MRVCLSSGEYDIVASGEVFLFGSSEDLVIHVDNGDNFQVKILMKFLEDDSGEHDIKTNVENDSLVITCVNFSSIGIGLKRPTHIANANGKKIYFMFSSSYLGDKDNAARSVKYTVFVEK